MSRLARLEAGQVKDLKTAVVRAAERWHDGPAFHFDTTGEQLSYAEVDKQTNALANGLRELGIQPGDRVAVMLRNQAAFLLAWLALVKIGAVMVSVNVFYKAEDAGFVLRDSEARAVITGREFIPMLRSLSEPDIKLEIFISADGEADGGALDLGQLIASADVSSPDFQVQPETVTNIQYTSGTTGPPKGCMLTNLYWTMIAQKWISGYPDLREADVVLCAQPFYYMDPLWNSTLCLLAGAKLVVLDRFHPSTFWTKVREYDVSFFYCLGMMPSLMLKMEPHPDDRKNRVRAIACSAIPVKLHHELEERWGVPWYETYGMTEIGGALRTLPEYHDDVVGTGCIGTPNDHREVRVVDDEDRILGRNVTGELVVRGIAMMDGYFKNRRATEEAFRGGWFHTGDIVRIDEAGRVYYIGRTKEMIRRSGENISATEVEGVIALNAGVRMVACIPVPDDVRGEEVKAYVVLTTGHNPKSLTFKELIDFCQSRLAYFKVPRYWAYRDDLPLTPSERVAKARLQEEGEDLRLGAYDRVDDVWR